MPDGHDENQKSYLGIGLAVGVAIGTAFGIALGHLALGIGCGVAIGVAIGTALSGHNQSRGKEDQLDGSGDNNANGA